MLSLKLRNVARLLYNYKCVIPSGSKAHVHHVFYLQKQEELVVVTAYDILFGQVCHPFETLELIQFFEQFAHVHFIKPL